MAYENWKRILDPWSTFKLSVAAALNRRPRHPLAPVGRRLLERVARDGIFWARFRAHGAALAASFRLDQLASDLQSFYEVGVGECYRLPPRFRPRTVVDGGANTAS